MITNAHLPRHPAAPTPALELREARRLRDDLTGLLRKEQAATAEFLVALAAFDRLRGWEVLGHASLFAFLNVELGLSPAPTYWRQEAARLLQRFPDLVEPLRQGSLCLTTLGELAKVLTADNLDAVLPRFLGISSREARQIVAELQPREAPPLRTMVTHIGLAHQPAPEPLARPATPAAYTDSKSLWAPKVEVAHPVRVPDTRTEVEPLAADLRRLHVTVSARLLEKVDAARDGLSNALPNATTEQVLEAALDLLLEKQARARGQVQKPRKTVEAVQATDPVPAEPPRHRRPGQRAAIPAAIRRAVWARDGGRCSWPLDGGGTCGSTHRLQLDHVVPWARGGDDSVGNLRIVCAAHNTAASRAAFGPRIAARYAPSYAGGGASPTFGAPAFR